MEKIIQKIIENYLFLLAAFALVYFNQKRLGFVSVKKRRAVFIMLMLAVFYLVFLLLIQRIGIRILRFPVLSRLFLRDFCSAVIRGLL